METRKCLTCCIYTVFRAKKKKTVKLHTPRNKNSCSTGGAIDCTCTGIHSELQ